MSKVLKDVQMLAKVSTIGTPGRGKGGKSERDRRRILSDHLLATAEAQGAALVAAAQERSRSLLAQAQEEDSVLKQQAWEEGFAQGMKEGEKQAQLLKEEAVALKKQARQMLTEAREQIATWFTEAEPEVVRLAVALAEKIVGHQLQVQPGLLVAMLKGLKLETGGEEVILKVKPIMAAALAEQRANLDAIFSRGGYRIEADEGVGEGILLETKFGTVDARLRVQLDELATILSGVVAHD